MFHVGAGANSKAKGTATFPFGAARSWNPKRTTAGEEEMEEEEEEARERERETQTQGLRGDAGKGLAQCFGGSFQRCGQAFS